MTREEAIKIVKEFINSTCLHLVDQEALKTLIPELKESEDEKIRKELLAVINDLVLPDEQRERFNTWLKKQKEPENVSASTMIPSCWEEEQKEQKPEEDWREKRKEECPFRRNLDNNLYGCERYAGLISECNGICSWVVDYPKLKEIQDKKEQEQPEVDLEKEIRKHTDLFQADIEYPLRLTAIKFYELGRTEGMYRDKTGETDEPCFEWKEYAIKNDELSEHELHIARHFYELGLNARKENIKDFCNNLEI